METVPIDGSTSLHRDMQSHAVININNSEYEAYMRQRALMAQSKSEASAQKETIQSLQNEVEQLKNLVNQLLNKDSNGTSITSK